MRTITRGIVLAGALTLVTSAVSAQAVSTRPVPAPRGIATTPAPAAPARPSHRPDDVIFVPVPVYYPFAYPGQNVPIPGGYVHEAPPGPQIEQPGMAPYAAMVWVPGRYQWNGAQYFWVPGTWVQLPGGYTQWVAGKWEHNDYGWYWISGYWR